MVDSGRILQIEGFSKGRDSVLRRNYAPSASNVKTKLSDRNGHPVDSEITQTEDTRPISDNADPRFRDSRPVSEDGFDVALILDRNKLKVLHEHYSRRDRKNALTRPSGRL
jgi:hypothetical protein